MKVNEYSEKECPQELAAFQACYSDFRVSLATQCVQILELCLTEPSFTAGENQGQNCD